MQVSAAITKNTSFYHIFAFYSYHEEYGIYTHVFRIDVYYQNIYECICGLFVY